MSLLLISKVKLSGQASELERQTSYNLKKDTSLEHKDLLAAWNLDCL